MAREWELNTVVAINERRADLGLPDLEWSGELESEARNYWSSPALCPNIVRSCSCPHWTSPKQICELLWCDELCDYSIRFVAVAIFNDNIAHAALALNQGMIGGNMPHKRVELNNTRKTNGYRSIIGWITGRRSAVFLKNRYQSELDNANAALTNEVHHGEDENRRKAFDYYNEVQALKADLDAHLAARDSSSQGSEAGIEKQREIHKKKEAFNRAVSGFNRELPSYKHNVRKCQDKLDRYHKILEEGTSKIEKCRYVRSFLFKILPEDKKAEILLDTLPHTIERWKTMIALFTEDLSQYQKQPFSELPY